MGDSHAEHFDHDVVTQSNGLSSLSPDLRHANHSRIQERGGREELRAHASASRKGVLAQRAFCPDLVREASAKIDLAQLFFRPHSDQT